jgi:hypothetical protein
MSGENNHMFGKFHKEETKALMRIPKTEGQKVKMSKAKTGENNSMYSRLGKNYPNFDKSFFPETKAKISNANGTVIYIYSVRVKH